MKRSIEELVTRCVSGKAPRDVLREFMEDSTSPVDVRSSILNELRRMDLDFTSVSVVESLVTIVAPESTDKSSLFSLVDTYNRIYPDVQTVVEFRMDAES